MIIYIINIILFTLLSYTSIKNAKIKVNAIGDAYKSPDKKFIILAVAVIMAVYIFRGYTGTDSSQYISSYRGMRYMSFSYILELSDVAFNVLCWIDYRVFGGSVELHYIVLAILTYVPIMFMYVRYTDNFCAAGTLYILTTGYYFGFNGQRQAVAVGICIIAFIELIKGNWKWFVIVVLIASRFHSTALFVLPIGFLTKLKTYSKPFIVIALCLFVSAMFAGSLWNQLFEILGMMGQDRLVDQYAGESTSYGGANILRVFVLAAPIIIGIIFYKSMSSRFKTFDMVLNLNIIGAICMLAGTSNWLFARLSAYTAPFIPMLLMQCGTKFESKSKIIYYLVVIVLYFIYMWVYVHMDSQMLPYIMLNGMRFN